jgi:hypothetical protein
MDPQVQLQALKNLFPQAELVTEQGRTAVLLPQVKFQAGGARVTRDLVLWPSERDSYSTRLFLSEQVAGATSRVWKSFSLCGGTWWAVSWRGVPATLPWIEILANHLKAFQ